MSIYSVPVRDEAYDERVEEVAQRIFGLDMSVAFDLRSWAGVDESVRQTYGRQATWAIESADDL